MLRFIVGVLCVGTVLSQGRGLRRERREDTTASTNTTSASIDYASLQYLKYAEEHPIPGVMCLSSGAPVKNRDAYVSINRKFLLNEQIMEELSHVVAENIPAKSNHEKGTAASGYFEVTHDITDICKAKLFSAIGKRTPIRARFSSGVTPVDTIRDLRGFAVKFYTEDGNFDIAGLNMAAFFSNDPLKFANALHLFKGNPITGMQDPNALFDYVLLNEELLLLVTMFFTDSFTPASYRTMTGYSQHAYQVSNANNDIKFVRFHFIPHNHTTLTAAQAATIAGQDINYLTRDLFNAIAAGDYPEWVVGIQVLTLDEIRKEPRLMDIARYLPEDRFPIQPVGKLVLNKNMDNFFAESTQMQFLPSNLVPGIQAPPDKVFQARAYAYRLSGNYRLGVNFNKIPVNQPLNKPLTYYKDGPPPVLDNEGGAPTYFPNSFNGPQPIANDEPETIDIVELPSYNRDQIDEFYRNLPEDQKTAVVQNMAATAVLSTEHLQEQLIKKLTEINEDYGTRLAAEIASLNAAST